MTFLKPLRAQRMLRLMLTNVRRYRAGSVSYACFFYRANKLWLMAQREDLDKVIEPAYKEALGFA